jgi:hypothetical protein
MILLDTDYLSVLADARHARHETLAGKLLGTDEPVSIPIIAVEEQLRAWLAQVHRTRDAQAGPYAAVVSTAEGWLRHGVEA